VTFILNDYISSEASFKALDAVLAGVNAENFNVDQMPSAASPFCARIVKALQIFESEHVSKLGTNAPVVMQAVNRIGQRIVRMFSLRVACVRPLSEAGRALLLVDVGVVQEALGKTFPQCHLDGLRELVARAKTPLELVQNKQISPSVAWHHLLASLPKSVHSPHTKRNTTLAAYLAELHSSKDEDAAAWAFIQPCLVGNHDFSAFWAVHKIWNASTA